MGGWPFSSSAYYGQAADMVFEVSLVVSAGESQNSGLMTEHGIGIGHQSLHFDRTQLSWMKVGRWLDLRRSSVRYFR